MHGVQGDWLGRTRNAALFRQHHIISLLTTSPHSLVIPSLFHTTIRGLTCVMHEAVFDELPTQHKEAQKLLLGSTWHHQCPMIALPETRLALQSSTKQYAARSNSCNPPYWDVHKYRHLEGLASWLNAPSNHHEVSSKSIVIDRIGQSYRL